MFRFSIKNCRIDFQLEEDTDTPPEDDIETTDDVEDTDTDDKEDKDENEDEEDKEDKEGTDEDKDIQLSRVDYTELKKEFPELFKKHPEFKHALFREQKFSEMFPTVEEAKNAVEQVEAYEAIRESVITGNAEKFITDLKEADEGGLKKFAANFLPAIEKVNKDLFLDLATPIVDKFIKNVYAHGKTIEKEEDRKSVMTAAKIVRRMLLGGDWDDIEKEFKPIISKEPSDDEKKLEEERKKLHNQKYQNLYAEVVNLCYGNLEKEIYKGLEDLKDNKGQQKLVAKEIKERILTALDKDQEHVNRINNLWKREARNGYQGTYKSTFNSNFMAKARTLLPKIRLEVRKELGLKASKNESTRDEPNRISAGSRSKESGGRMTPELAKKEGLSTRELFNPRSK